MNPITLAKLAAAFTRRAQILDEIEENLIKIAKLGGKSPQIDITRLKLERAELAREKAEFEHENDVCLPRSPTLH